MKLDSTTVGVLLLWILVGSEQEGHVATDFGTRLRDDSKNNKGLRAVNHSLSTKPSYIKLCNFSMALVNSTDDRSSVFTSL